MPSIWLLLVYTIVFLSVVGNNPQHPIIYAIWVTLTNSLQYGRVYS